MEQITGLDFKIQEMAARIRDLRESEGYSVEEMADATLVSPEEYLSCENGQQDLNFTFIYRCALKFGVNVTDIIEGYSPTLRSYTLTRAGKRAEDIASTWHDLLQPCVCLPKPYCGAVVRQEQV